MYTPSRHYLECHIAGFTYWDGLDAVNQLKLGAEVHLEIEPDNPHDSSAVAIYFETTKIGYVPKTYNKELSTFLFFGHGNIFETRISAIYPNNHLEQQYRISIRIKDNREQIFKIDSSEQA